MLIIATQPTALDDRMTTVVTSRHTPRTTVRTYDSVAMARPLPSPSHSRAFVVHARKRCTIGMDRVPLCLRTCVIRNA